MVHLIKKRTVFQKGNYTLISDRKYLDFIFINKKIGRSGHHFINVPFYFPSKITVVENKINDFIQKKTILNWF